MSHEFKQRTFKAADYKDARPTELVWGAMIPLHWRWHMENIAQSELGDFNAIHTLVVKRIRKMYPNTTNVMIEKAAEERGVSTSSFKRAMIKKAFANDNLPEWTMPKPSLRRTMTKGRKLLQEEPVKGSKRTNASGVFIKIPPEAVIRLTELASSRGWTIEQLALRLFSAGASSNGMEIPGVNAKRLAKEVEPTYEELHATTGAQDEQT